MSRLCFVHRRFTFLLLALSATAGFLHLEGRAEALCTWSQNAVLTQPPPVVSVIQGKGASKTVTLHLQNTAGSAGACILRAYAATPGLSIYDQGENAYLALATLGSGAHVVGYTWTKDVYIRYNGANFTTGYIEIRQYPDDLSDGYYVMGYISVQRDQRLFRERVGSTGADDATEVAFLPNHTLAWAGTFMGAVQVGQKSMTSEAGSVDAFIAHDSATGLPLWVTQLSGDGWIEITGLAASADSVYASATFSGNVTIGTTRFAASGSDALVVRLSESDGRVLWARRLGGSGNQRGTALATTSAGQPIVAWTTGPNCYLYWYNTSGSLARTRSLTSTGSCAVNDLAVGPSDTVHAIGDFNPTVNTNPGGSGGSFTSYGGPDIFVSKYSATGGHVWSKHMGSSTSGVLVRESGTSIAVETSGVVTVGGSFEGILWMETSFWPWYLFGSKGLSDGFVMRIQANGGLSWRRSLGGLGYDYVDDVASDNGNLVAVAGSIASYDQNEWGFSAVDLGGVGESRFGGWSDAYLAYFDGGSGDHLGSETFGSSADTSSFGIIGNEWDRAASIAYDSLNGSMAIAGRFWGVADFGANDRLVSSGGSDAFLAVYRP